MLRVVRFLCAVLVGSTLAASAGDWWRTYEGVEFDDGQHFDGDSFHLKVKSGKRIYDWVIRLYGVDCPETDNRFPKQNEKQAEHFKVPEADIPKLGKEASALARKLLKDAREIRLHVRAAGKKKTRKAPGQKQRYYGIVELIDRAGKSVMLHERLLEEGQARAFGLSAPWPPKEAARLGEQKVEKGFERDLERLERAAKKQKRGIWGQPNG